MSATTPHQFRLQVFEGPLDLLLHLVKINEMDIHDIEISQITRQYLDYVAALQELNLELAGDFLVMAATLMNIKSRSLLPANPIDEELNTEEEIDEILSTQELIRRLVEYRKVKQLAQALHLRGEENNRIYYRANVIPVVPGADEDLPRQDIRTLFDAFARVIKKVRVEASHNIVSESFSVEEKSQEIRERLRTHRQINFSRVFEACVSKDEIICYFLAVLEMARLREITLAQAGPFEDILVEPWDDKVIYVG
ncbi:MAG: segregation/condensation protein A [Candidatus Sumerlaeia bacterium]|nr:segregation/condensation protein A [Candidatus Sumerlaeia bacterium]